MRCTRLTLGLQLPARRRRRRRGDGDLFAPGIEFLGGGESSGTPAHSPAGAHVGQVTGALSALKVRALIAQSTPSHFAPSRMKLLVL